MLDVGLAEYVLDVAPLMAVSELHVLDVPLVSDDNVWTRLDPLPHVDVADEYNLAV